MTKTEMGKLDESYQVILLEQYDYESILGGEATLIHHFKLKSEGLSLRWYVPNGISLNAFQHNPIHAGSNEGIEFENRIKKIKGKEWLEDLNRQRNKIAKYLKYEDVLAHIMGVKDNYI